MDDLERSHGQETVQRLSSLLGCFLSHAHYMRAVTLQLLACCRRHEYENDGRGQPLVWRRPI